MATNKRHYFIFTLLLCLASFLSCQQRYAHRAKVKMPQEKQQTQAKPEIHPYKQDEDANPKASTKLSPDELATQPTSPQEKSITNQPKTNQTLEHDSLDPTVFSNPNQPNWRKRMVPESSLPRPHVYNSKENTLIFLTFLFWIVVFQLLLVSLSLLVIFVVLYSPFFVLTIPAGFILEKVLIGIGIYLISLILPYLVARNILNRKYGLNTKQPNYIILFVLALLTSFVVPILLAPLSIIGLAIYLILLFILGFRLMVGKEKE